MENEEKTKALLESLELTKSGYAGIMPDGTKVDRRHYPNAVPLEYNEALGIPYPKKFNEDAICLQKIEDELRRVIAMLSNYKDQVEELKNLHYTPSTIILLRHIKNSLENENMLNLNKAIDEGIELDVFQATSIKSVTGILEL